MEPKISEFSKKCRRISGIFKGFEKGIQDINEIQKIARDFNGLLENFSE